MDKIAEYITLVLNDYENSKEKVRAGVEEICKKYQVTCIYHTFYEEAKKAGVRNIHLPLWKLEELNEEDGQRDFDLIGASIHSVEEAKKAEKLGATYLTAGHIYETGCKPDLPPEA